MKSNTNKLRAEIVRLIAAECENVYYLNFPKPAKYPYTVFELREIAVNDGQTSYSLEIDVVSNDTKEVINIADSIQDVFDHREAMTNDFFFHSYRARRYAMVEDDKNIQRIHLSMDLFFYSKEE